jgi:hypothetical protein
MANAQCSCSCDLNILCTCYLYPSSQYHPPPKLARRAANPHSTQQDELILSLATAKRKSLLLLPPPPFHNPPTTDLILDLGCGTMLCLVSLIQMILPGVPSTYGNVRPWAHRIPSRRPPPASPTTTRLCPLRAGTRSPVNPPPPPLPGRMSVYALLAAFRPSTPAHSTLFPPLRPPLTSSRLLPPLLHPSLCSLPSPHPHQNKTTTGGVVELLPRHLHLRLRRRPRAHRAHGAVLHRRLHALHLRPPRPQPHLPVLRPALAL